MRTTQFTLTLICTLLISGCANFGLETGPSATKESHDDIVTMLTGKPLSFVESHLGLPNQRSESASGAMTWVYIDKSKRITEKDCKMSISIRNDIIERVNITVSNASLASALDKGCARIRQKIR